MSTLADSENQTSRGGQMSKQGSKSKGAPPTGGDGKAIPSAIAPDAPPSEDEPFMNDRQRRYFRAKLLAWRAEILEQNRETLVGLHDDSGQHADITDRATSETDRAQELRTRDRQRKVISKIDAALGRLDDGTFGYCEETGEPIGLKRLDARPIATLSLEAQERHERREKVYRDE
jgi:DnaK suppressor protein